MGSEDYKIVKGFINDDEVLQIVSWVDLLNPEDGEIGRASCRERV